MVQVAWGMLHVKTSNRRDRVSFNRTDSVSSNSRVMPFWDSLEGLWLKCHNAGRVRSEGARERAHSRLLGALIAWWRVVVYGKW